MKNYVKPVFCLLLGTLCSCGDTQESCACRSSDQKFVSFQGEKELLAKGSDHSEIRRAKASRAKCVPRRSRCRPRFVPYADSPRSYEVAPQQHSQHSVDGQKNKESRDDPSSRVDDDRQKSQDTRKKDDWRRRRYYWGYPAPYGYQYYEEEGEYVDPMFGAVEVRFISPKSPNVRAGQSVRMSVAIMNTSRSELRAQVRLQLPSGWHALPDRARFLYFSPGQSSIQDFTILVPMAVERGSYPISIEVQGDETPDMHGFDQMTMVVK